MSDTIDEARTDWCLSLSKHLSSPQMHLLNAIAVVQVLKADLCDEPAHLDKLRKVMYSLSLAHSGQYPTSKFSSAKAVEFGNTMYYAAGVEDDSADDDQGGTFSNV